MRILPTSDTTLPSLYLWKFLQKSTVEVNSNKIYGMLGLMSVLHIVGYLPSFSDADGTEVDSTQGFGVIILLILIAMGMTWFHPVSTIEE